jgi:hypothetical protein
MFLFKGELAPKDVDAKYMSHTLQFFTMENSARIHFRDEENLNGPAVVLVHGFNALLHTW